MGVYGCSCHFGVGCAEVVVSSMLIGFLFCLCFYLCFFLFFWLFCSDYFRSGGFFLDFFCFFCVLVLSLPCVCCYADLRHRQAGGRCDWTKWAAGGFSGGARFTELIDSRGGWCAARGTDGTCFEDGGGRVEGSPFAGCFFEVEVSTRRRVVNRVCA